jgi:hypothetical protein
LISSLRSFFRALLSAPILLMIVTLGFVGAAAVDVSQSFGGAERGVSVFERNCPANHVAH